MKIIARGQADVKDCQERWTTEDRVFMLSNASYEPSDRIGDGSSNGGSWRAPGVRPQGLPAGLLIAVLALLFAAAPRTTAKNQVVARVWLKDQLGRRVRVPLEPRRIVSLAPSITEIVYALGCGGRLVGVTRFSDYPAAAKKLPKVGTYVHPDLERIVALRPDLCIATKDGNPEVLVKRLQELDIPVFAVNPRNLDEIVQTVGDIGRLLHTDRKSEALAGDMRQRIETVRRLVAKATYRPKVFFQIGVAPMVSAGSGTYIDELIRTAGGRNIAAGPNPYPRFTREQVLAAAPDVIVITSMARGAVFQRVKARWMRWPSLPAVRHQRIHIVDSNLFDRPTPRLVEGLEILARLLHPELFRG